MTHLDPLGLTWTHLDSLRLVWIHLHSHGLTWTYLDSLGLGFTWTRVVSLGFTWTPLDSLGPTWIHVDSVGLTWTHWVPPGTRGRIPSPKEKGKAQHTEFYLIHARHPGRAHTLAHAWHDTKQNDFPVGLTPQPPIYTCVSICTCMTAYVSVSEPASTGHVPYLYQEVIKLHGFYITQRFF